MFIVITKVELKPDTAADCMKLFERTNPNLVRGEPDWLGAQMMIDRMTNTITVLAKWKDESSYRAFSTSSEFQKIMGQFRRFFADPPEVTVNELLLEMSEDTI